MTVVDTTIIRKEGRREEGRKEGRKEERYRKSIRNCGIVLVVSVPKIP